MSVLYNDVRYRDNGGSPQMLVDEDGNEAPFEAYVKDAKKAMHRAGIKPAGARRKPLTKGERRRALYAQGHTLEAIAAAEGVEIEAVLRSMRPSRTNKRGGQ